jgi:hypothetical protein
VESGVIAGQSPLGKCQRFDLRVLPIVVRDVMAYGLRSCERDMDFLYVSRSTTMSGKACVPFQYSECLDFIGITGVPFQHLSS